MFHWTTASVRCKLVDEDGKKYKILNGFDPNIRSRRQYSTKIIVNRSRKWFHHWNQQKVGWIRMGADRGRMSRMDQSSRRMEVRTARKRTVGYARIKGMLRNNVSAIISPSNYEELRKEMSHGSFNHGRWMRVRIHGIRFGWHYNTLVSGYLWVVPCQEQPQMHAELSFFWWYWICQCSFEGVSVRIIDARDVQVKQVINCAESVMTLRDVW